jgi:DNA-binding NtrC family response regulator
VSASLLLVEPDVELAAQLQRAAADTADVAYCPEFSAAKRQLLDSRFDYLVTNVRLQEYNGLHLAYLASVTGAPGRCIAYTNERDPFIAREVHRAGAFYEIGACLAVALGAYLQARLPESDRRDPASFDRRGLFRGGRRCWDQHRVSTRH